MFFFQEGHAHDIAGVVPGTRNIANQGQAQHKNSEKYPNKINRLKMKNAKFRDQVVTVEEELAQLSEKCRKTSAGWYGLAQKRRATL